MGSLSGDLEDGASQGDDGQGMVVGEDGWSVLWVKEIKDLMAFTGTGASLSVPGGGQGAANGGL